MGCAAEEMDYIPIRSVAVKSLVTDYLVWVTLFLASEEVAGQQESPADFLCLRTQTRFVVKSGNLALAGLISRCCELLKKSHMLFF
jgi:hypothetical protein